MIWKFESCWGHKFIQVIVQNCKVSFLYFRTPRRFSLHPRMKSWPWPLRVSALTFDLQPVAFNHFPLKTWPPPKMRPWTLLVMSWPLTLDPWQVVSTHPFCWMRIQVLAWWEKSLNFELVTKKCIILIICYKQLQSCLTVMNIISVLACWFIYV